jgi:DNA-binding response OmpR family regulator
MKKILIVEDHADIRRLIRMTLEFEDCEVHEACDALSGWALVQQIKPDVVLLDVMMPGGPDGLDLCLAIKIEPDLDNVRVIMLSARGHAEDRQAGMNAGADLYMVKPFSPMQLLAAIQDDGVPA